MSRHGNANKTSLTMDRRLRGLVEVLRKCRQLDRKRVEEVGLKFPKEISLLRLQILLEVSLDPGVTQSELAERLGLEQAVLSRNLRYWIHENMGGEVGAPDFVEKRKGDDRRPNSLHLTIKGHAFVKQVSELLRRFN